jgi:hypothetical protein
MNFGSMVLMLGSDSLRTFDRGKPKKGGRPGGRDGKRLRPSNDPDLDDEDDY